MQVANETTIVVLHIYFRVSELEKGAKVRLGGRVIDIRSDTGAELGRKIGRKGVLKNAGIEYSCEGLVKSL